MSEDNQVPKETKGYKKEAEGVTNPSISKQTLEILQQLANKNYTVSQLAKKLNKSRKNVNKHYKILQDLHFFDKKQGVTSGGYNFLSYPPKGLQPYRINGASAYFKLPNSVDRFKWKSQRSQFLALKKISYKSIGLKNDAGQQFRLDRLLCRSHANGVRVFIPDIIHQDPYEAERIFLEQLWSIGTKLSRLFNIDFVKDDRLNVTVTNYELAHMKDKLAQTVREDNSTCYVYVEDALRVIIDYSKGVDELETVSPLHAVDDQQQLQEYLKDIITAQHYKPSEIKSYFDLILNVQVEYAEQIKKHLLVQDETLKTLRKIQGAMSHKSGNSQKRLGDFRA